MSGDEGFLTRWSRRKRRAPRPSDERARAVAADPAIRGEPAAAVASAGEAAPADLPPLEAIGPDTDIRAFLAAGVPADLTRAALRRAWSADPAIRDFVGLSENSWDFTAAGGVPGFGSIAADEVQRLLDSTAPPETATAPAEPPSPAAGAPAVPLSDATKLAARPEPAGNRPAEPPRRGHGGALPK